MNRTRIALLGAFLAVAPLGIAEAMPNALISMAPATVPGMASPSGDGSAADGATVEKTYWRYRRYYGYRRYYRPYYRYRPYYGYRHYYYRPFF